MSEDHSRVTGRTPPRKRSRAFLLFAGLAIMTALGGCGCRPGYIGPYGGVHPGRCWIG